MPTASSRYQSALGIVFKMGLWRGKTPLILASQSGVRTMLLANAGLQFEAIAADIDERGTQAASKIFQTARDWPLLARQKAKAVSAHPSGGYVIRADQTLVTVWAPNPEAKSRLRASAALHRRNRSCDHEAYGDRQRWESMFVSLTRVAGLQRPRACHRTC
ncbi:hypothetical protein ACVW0I_001559 [Bradyrhizobium sp. LM6.11]